MRKSTTEKRQDDWNSFFSQLIRRSRVRPTSAAIGSAVRKRLPESRSRGVSDGLVQKWRSSNSQRKLVPSDEVVARALLGALDELGVFRDSATADDDRHKLLDLLGYDLTVSIEDTLGKMAKAAQDGLLNVLDKRGVPSKQLSEPELQLAAVCQLSQLPVEEDVKRLVSNNGQAVIHFIWDGRSNSEANTSRNRLVKEVEQGGLSPFLRDAYCAKGTKVDCAFGVYARDDRGKERCRQELEALARTIAADSDHHHDQGGVGPILRFWECTVNAAPTIEDHFWIHLHPKDDPRAWRMIRHFSLFEKIWYSSACTFASPLEPHDVRLILRRLGIEWSEIDSSWTVPSDACFVLKRDRDATT